MGLLVELVGAHGIGSWGAGYDGISRRPGIALFAQNVQTMDSTEPKAFGASPASQPAAWETSTQFAPTQFGPGAEGGRPPPPSPFDVCHVGVVLRVVMGVQLVVALGVSFLAASPLDAASRW